MRPERGCQLRVRLVSMLGQSSCLEEAVWKTVVVDGRKWSTRLNYLIDLQTSLNRRGELVPVLRVALKSVKKVIEEMLLREVPNKASMLTPAQLGLLAHETDPRFAVTLSLMLPAGARFADVARLRRSDVVDFVDSVLCLRVAQAKNIRSRKHQRFLSLSIPRSLSPFLLARILVAAPSEALVQVSYAEMMRYLKAKLGSGVTTYSIRRSVFDQIRRRVRTIEEMAQVTLHRSTDQLRWYLEAPLPDEIATQVSASSWHQGL